MAVSLFSLAVSPGALPTLAMATGRDVSTSWCSAAVTEQLEHDSNVDASYFYLRSVVVHHKNKALNPVKGSAQKHKRACQQAVLAISAYVVDATPLVDTENRVWRCHRIIEALDPLHIAIDQNMTRSRRESVTCTHKTTLVLFDLYR